MKVLKRDVCRWSITDSSHRHFPCNRLSRTSLAGGKPVTQKLSMTSKRLGSSLDLAKKPGRYARMTSSTPECRPSSHSRMASSIAYSAGDSERLHPRFFRHG